jgi:hypothetical protein
MPLARYFLLVGGALLTLLVIVNACLPALPIAVTTHSNPVVIRIQSQQKLPERVVYDTSRPTLIPEPTVAPERTPSEPATDVAEIPVKVREALAQLPPSVPVQSRPAQPTRRDAKPHHQRKSAKTRREPYEFRIAQPAHFGWFGYGTW